MTDSEKEIQTNRTSTIPGIAELSNKLIDEDFVEGPLKEQVLDHINSPSEVAPFVKGLRLGAAYAITLIVTGKLDLTLLEIDKDPGEENMA